MRVDRAMRRLLAGRRGERQAESFLTGHGLVLVERNWRCRHGEIDLVMAHGDTLVFVEVRSRAATRFADGTESVDRAKRRRLIASARDFLMRNPDWADAPCRFDVVGIDATRQNIEWVEHAFEVE